MPSSKSFFYRYEISLFLVFCCAILSVFGFFAPDGQSKKLLQVTTNGQGMPGRFFTRSTLRTDG
jgi:hypothetical protein